MRVKKKLSLFKKVTICIGIYLVVLFLLEAGSTLSKYFENLRSGNKELSLAKPVIVLNTNSSTTETVKGSKVVEYFTLSNFDNDGTTEISLVPYIRIVDVDNNIIDAKIYVQDDVNNPNDYTLLEETGTGNLETYVKGSTLNLTKETRKYKFVIDEINSTNVSVDVQTIQLEANGGDQ